MLLKKPLFLLSFLILFIPFISCAQNYNYIKDNYIKHEYRIPMRDGVKLFTAVYSPKNMDKKYPIIMIRTPYSVAPYGEDKYPENFQLPEQFEKDGYIFVFQDVRGKFMSEGTFVNMRPYIPNKKSNKDIDETTDTYDTIDWLIKNIKNNNGKVGIWGISYPGFYAAMSTIDAHPALKAVSPQAPIADWFIGDDMHHNGAFSLMLNFDFFRIFGLPRTGLTTEWKNEIYYPSPDAYNFFLNLGALPNANKNYFHNKVAFWDSSMSHGTYDYFWKSRSNLPYFKNIKPAVMIVGGWYDAEDLYGPLHIYQSIENKNKNNSDMIVMGPWFHGGWARAKGDSLGDFSFGGIQSEFYQKNILYPFFTHYLKGNDSLNLPEAYVFDTGLNKWESFNSWPPQNIKPSSLYFNSNKELTFTNEYPKRNIGFDEYLSDPNKPVPYTVKQLDSKAYYNRNYMIEDQRFASERPDVLVYETKSLENNVTIAGPITADLYFSTSGTDADIVVKVIDVFPDDAENPKPNPNHVEMGGYERLVRADIMRGKFRNSYEKPEPFTPNKTAEVKVHLNDINHTFVKGHKIMVQIQSSWFPIFDRNPQAFVDIYNAKDSDFKKAFNRIYHSDKYQSKINFNVLEKN